jgi:hypothetical protein
MSHVQRVVPFATSSTVAFARTLRAVASEDIDWLMQEDALFVDDDVVWHHHGDVGLGEANGAARSPADYSVHTAAVLGVWTDCSESRISVVGAGSVAISMLTARTPRRPGPRLTPCSVCSMRANATSKRSCMCIRAGCGCCRDYLQRHLNLSAISSA